MSKDYSKLGFATQISKDRKCVEIMRFGKVIKAYRIPRTQKGIALYNKRLSAFLARFDREVAE